MSVDNQKLVLASILIDDAVYGRDFPFRDDSKSLWWYKFYNNGVANFVNYVAVTLLLLLALFEEPASCVNCKFPLWAIIIWEIVCLAEIMFRLFIRFKFCGFTTFIKDLKNVVSITTVAVTILDLIIYAGMSSTGLYPQRVSRILRPIFVINATESRRIRRVVRCIRALIKDVTPIFVLFFIIVGVFALIFFKIFGGQNMTFFDGRTPPTPYFENYLDTFWDLFVYVTTSNSPDAMQPAYDKSYWYSFMFIAFLALTLWGVMPIILAITYNSYLRYLKAQIKLSVTQKRMKLKRAFALLATKNVETGENVVTRGEWDRLAAINLASKEMEYRRLVFDMLDTSCSKTLNLSEFLYLSDLLNIDIRRNKTTIHVFERIMPVLYYTRISQLIRRVVLHPFFTYIFDILIVANTVVLAACSTEVVNGTEWAFLILFTTEVCLKIYTNGPLIFVGNGWNIFDFALVSLAWVAAVAENISPNVKEIAVFYDLVITIRVLRVFRIVYSIKQFVVIVNTFHHILPSVAAVVVLLLCVYYMFAVLGMMLFSGVVRDDIHPWQPGWENCGNPKIEGSGYAGAHYCKANFNSLALSFILLFDLTAVNNWHLFSEAFTLATSRAARLYFIGFYFVVIYVILNIFIAFVLEAFLLQYRLFRGEQPESPLRLHVSRFLEAVSGRKKVATPTTQKTFLGNIVATSSKDASAGTHIEWTVGENLPTISLWGPTANEANIGFLMRNTYRDADTLLETMLLDDEEVTENQAAENGPLKQAGEDQEKRQRATSSVWRRSNLHRHSIFQQLEATEQEEEEEQPQHSEHNRSCVIEMTQTA